MPTSYHSFISFCTVPQKGTPLNTDTHTHTAFLIFKPQKPPNQTSTEPEEKKRKQTKKGRLRKSREIKPSCTFSSCTDSRDSQAKLTQRLTRMESETKKDGTASGGEVLDGSNIMKLVENKEVFGNFVDHKFQELDTDRDGQLSVKELQPAVADIGAALGLPAQGSSPDSDHIYSEVLSEFTHGKQDKVSKIEFKEVLSDILLGMAAGLKRDPIVILRIDGEDLLEYINGPTYEADMVSAHSLIESAGGTLRDCVIKAFEMLTVEQGMPPSSDPWVVSNILEPALQSCAGPDWNKPVSQETFLVEFKKVAEHVAELLREQHVIVAHSENTFDGSGIRRLLSNKFEFDKTLNAAMETAPRDRTGKISTECLHVTLDVVAPSAGLPPLNSVEQMDTLIMDAFKLTNADDGKLLKEDEFKKLLAEILGSIMLQLEGNPISVYSNSVVHEPIASASTLLQTPP